MTKEALIAKLCRAGRDLASRASHAEVDVALATVLDELIDLREEIEELHRHLSIQQQDAQCVLSTAREAVERLAACECAAEKARGSNDIEALIDDYAEQSKDLQRLRDALNLAGIDVDTILRAAVPEITLRREARRALLEPSCWSTT